MHGPYTSRLESLLSVPEFKQLHFEEKSRDILAIVLPWFSPEIFAMLDLRKAQQGTKCSEKRCALEND
jgi:hypothetical protein